MTVTEPTAEPQATTKRTNMPKYGVGEPVAELPTEPERTKGKVYYDLMEQVKNDPDKQGLWVPIADFQTPTGARDAQKALAGNQAKGVAPTREIPTGEWEIKAVKLPHPSNPTKRVSRLYVRYLGEG